MMRIIRYIERIEGAFPRLPDIYRDNSGWQVKLHSRTSRVLAAVSLAQEVIDEAISCGAGMIITHHPLFYKPFSAIDESTYQGSMIARLCRKNISLYALHTPIDSGTLGLADYWACRLGLTGISPVEPGASIYKVIVYIPEKSFEKVRSAVLAAAQQGEPERSYSDVSFHSAGFGRFTPSFSAKPAIGKKGRETEVNELKLECVVPQHNLDSVREAIKQAHPYEEPAFEVWPLTFANTCCMQGIGRRGTLKKSKSLKEIVRLFADNGVSIQGFSGNNQKTFDKIAIIPGSGSDFLHLIQEGELCVTGDVGYHEAEYARDHNFTLLKAPHWELEAPFAEVLRQAVDPASCGIELFSSHYKPEIHTF